MPPDYNTVEGLPVKDLAVKRKMRHKVHRQEISNPMYFILLKSYGQHKSLQKVGKIQVKVSNFGT
jgi:hypothetical protein